MYCNRFATSAAFRNVWNYAVLPVLLKMFTSGSAGTITTYHLRFMVLFVLFVKRVRQQKHRKHRRSWRILQPYVLVSAGAHQPGLSYIYTQRPYLYVFWFNKELTGEIIMLRSQGLAAANNTIHSSWLFRAIIISRPLFIPTNAHKYFVKLLKHLKL